MLGHHPRVAFGLGQLLLQGAVGEVQQVAGQVAHRAVHAGRLVDLAAAAPAAAPAVEQAQHPVGIGVAMAQEPAEVVRQAREAVAGGAVETAVASPQDRRAQGVVDALVRVQAQHPVVAGLGHGEGLLAAVAVEGAVQHGGAVGGGDGRGGVGGARIDHDDLVAEVQRAQAIADAIGFVERDNAGRDARPFAAGGR